MQLAPKPSTDNLDLYIQLIESQNQRQKNRLMKLGLLIGLALLLTCAAVFFIVSNPFGGKSNEQLTYLMFQSDYLPHQDIMNFLSIEGHGVIIKDRESNREDTLSSIDGYDSWLIRNDRKAEFTSSNFRPAETTDEEADEPAINKIPMGLILRGQLEAERNITFVISGYNPDFKYYIDLGNGIKGSVRDKSTFKYRESGNFLVKLTASDEDGNTRTIRRRINIRLPRPADEVVAQNETTPPSNETLVITDLGENEGDEPTDIAVDPTEGEDVAADTPVENVEEIVEEAPTPAAVARTDSEDNVEEVQTKEESTPAASQQLDLSNQIFMGTEVPPTYQGGNRELRKFLSRNLRYPQAAMDKEIEGKVVVQFVVRSDGSLDSPKIIKGLGYGCDKEVLRIISRMPNWNPGTLGGKAVNSMYSFPVSFQIR
ncbi:MAG: TonB family protein [Bacteroidota bacterium]